MAIITGGSRGIGRQAALRLAADGFDVVLGYMSAHKQARETVEAIEKAGGRAIAVAGDISEPQAATALFDAAETHFGGVDVVVHAAGVMTALKPITATDFEALDRVYAVNVRGSFLVAQQAARRVREGGAILTFSTSAIALARPGYAVYTSSKAAVEAMTRTLARELRGRDITVNAVAPGPTETELFFEGKDQAAIDRLTKEAPLERLGTPEDIAEAVAFLAGPARWVHGQVIRVNGGSA